MITNCDQNNHHIRVWLLNNYKIKVMIEFSDQKLNKLDLVLDTNVLMFYSIKFYIGIKP